MIPALIITVVVVALVVCMGLGLRGARRSWKDRILSGSPVCSGCQYDLSATPDGMACPECGRVTPARLRRNTTGKLRRPTRFTLQVLGIAMSCLLLALVPAAIRKLGGLWPFLPLGVLEWEAENGRLQAVYELQLRLGEGSVDADRVRKLISLALRMRESSDTFMQSSWNGVADACCRTGNCSQAQVLEFLKGVIVVEWTIGHHNDSSAKSPRSGYVGVKVSNTFTPPPWLTQSIVIDRVLVGSHDQTDPLFHNTKPGSSSAAAWFIERPDGQTVTLAWTVLLSDTASKSPILSWSFTEVIRVPESKFDWLRGSRAWGTLRDQAGWSP